MLDSGKKSFARFELVKLRQIQVAADLKTNLSQVLANIQEGFAVPKQMFAWVSQVRFAVQTQTKMVQFTHLSPLL